jgi:polyvinyl alcohol dehydrogenase (cytochrome)
MSVSPAGRTPTARTTRAARSAGIWTRSTRTPVRSTIDPRSGTLFVGTGQNYTGSAGDFDSLLALDTRTGAVRWKNQVTKADTWRSLCNDPEPEGYCPGLGDGTALDYDIGATPNIFRAGDRTLVGVGQKLLPSGGIAGIQWGSSYDSERLYISTYFADPGTVFAVDPATGKVLWQTPNPADGCTTGGAAAHPDICALAHGPAATSSPGLVYEGGNDGKLRAYASDTGKVLCYDTIQDVTGVNGLVGRGGAISGTGGGAVVSRGMVYVQSGYFPGYPSEHGPVLLAFGL